MHNLFDTATYNNVLQRLEKLDATAQRKWGSMDAAQALAHCSETFHVALGEKTGKTTLMAMLFGKMAKKSILNAKPFPQKLPTAKEFVIHGTRDFNTEKEKLTELVKRFYAAKDTMTDHKHFFFGMMTPAEWSRSMYKHLDHHLKQFGA